MKRISRALVVLVAVLIAVLAVFVSPAKAAAEVLESGMWGTCPWEITDDGVLTVHPGIGESQEGKRESPWSGYQERITAVVFAGEDGGKVVTPEDSSYLLADLEYAVSIDISNLDTSQAKNLSHLFERCMALASIDVSAMDTSAATDISWMFFFCRGLTSLDVSSFDTCHVTNMQGVFHGCMRITSLDVSGWDTSSVTDMQNLFGMCVSLPSLDIQHFDTSNVKKFSEMFVNDRCFTTLDVTGFDTSSADSMMGMFESCESLTSLDVSGFDVSGVREFQWMFQDCSSLTELDLSNWESFYDASIWMDSMFKGCSKLKTIYAAKTWPTNMYVSSASMFEGCTSLVGGCGTTYNAEHADKSYAHADRVDYPGYFTEVRVSNFESGTACLSFGSTINTRSNGSDPAAVPVDVYWNDALFFADSSKYYHSLATVSSVLADAVYHDDSRKDLSFAYTDLTVLGFDMSTYQAWYPHKESEYDGDIDQVGYCFAVKWMGGSTPLVAVLVRGTTKNIEWVSNFNIAENSYPNDEHEGFSDANESLLVALNEYLSSGKGSAVNLSQARFLVTGHSRGAAVANLLAHSLDQGRVRNSSGYSSKERVYAYTFATPSVTCDSNMGSSEWNNIFNIVNLDDAIPKLPLAKWGFGRYGTTKELPSKSNTESWYYYRDRLLRPTFESLTDGVKFAYYAQGALASDKVANALYGIAHNTFEYYFMPTHIGVHLKMLTDGMFIQPYEFTRAIGYVLGGAETSADTALWAYDLFEVGSRCYPLFMASLIGNIFVDTYLSDGFVFVDAFTHAHTPETYIAWMLCGNEKMYQESYRGLKVACPVDIKVYASDGTLVCSIVDDVVDEAVMENGLAAMVVGDVKYIDIPSDGEYRVEVTATDDGTMDIAYETRDAEGKVESQVAYADVALVEGESYTVGIAEQGDATQAQETVAVVDGDDVVVEPSHVAGADEIAALEIQVDVAEGDGYVGGSTLATWGDPVVATAQPADGASFLGWYRDGELVSAEASYSFRAEESCVLEARFTKTISVAYVAPIEAQAYSGKQIKPAFTVQYREVELAEGVDYTVSYSDNVAIGTATVTLTGKGEYGGTATFTFQIIHAPGWAKENGGYYFYENDGSLRKNAWSSYGGTWYYLGSDGKLVTNGWATYQGKYYFMGSNGKVTFNGWAKYEGKWYYMNGSGNPTVGWASIGGSWYYFNADGTCLTNGWAPYEGKDYYMGSDGRVVTNRFVSVGGEWYYLNASGNVVTNDWIYYGGKYYHLNEKGNPDVDKWIEYEGVWYHVNSQGAVDNSWRAA